MDTRTQDVDLALSVWRAGPGNNRELMQKNKLTISKHKTVAIMLKGKFNTERRPRIQLQGEHLKFRDEVN